MCAPTPPRFSMVGGEIEYPHGTFEVMLDFARIQARLRFGME